MRRKKTVLDELLNLLNEISSSSWKAGIIISCVFYLISFVALDCILAVSSQNYSSFSLVSLLPILYAVPAVTFLLGLYFSIMAIKVYLSKGWYGY